MRVTITDEPFTDLSKGWHDRGDWPAKWIAHPEVQGVAPAVVAYRRKFALEKAAKVRIHASADERYELFLDGARIGRGPERGDRENWFYETYDLDLSAGEHVLVARTWWLGPKPPAPYAQHSVRPGFLLAAEGRPDDFLNTGAAEWACKKLGGHEFIPPGRAWGTGAKLHIKGADFPWGYEEGNGDGWRKAQVVGKAANASVANEHQPIWMLRPAMLPAMLEETLHVGEARHVQVVKSEDTRGLPVKHEEHLDSEAQGWNHLLAAKSPLTIPPKSTRRVIVDLGNYYCAYPEIVTSGGKGSKVRILWAEALYEKLEGGSKGNRDEIEGKYFIGIGDTFEPDGGGKRLFDTLWWEAGRYLEVVVSTGDAPLTIESFAIRETHYPYDWESEFESADPRLEEVVPIARRVLEMCSHETYMDCPYYEQLQYVGDTRLEVLATYAMTRDDRLPRKAILMFDVSRRISGITQSRYPSRVMQIIPPFSLWWIGMVHDYALWRDDLGFVADRMPGVRAVLDAFRRWVNKDGLLDAPNGWNFMDWVPGWGGGIPPDGHTGISGVINWQYAHVLGLAAELEEFVSEPELALRNRKLAEKIARATSEAFWDESRGIFADDLIKKHFSEHAQCLALLSGRIEESKRDRVAEGLLRDPELARTTIYFTHYLFETYRLLGRIDRLFERMGLWFDMKGLGFKTTLEHPEPSRSDCHAWGAHPMYHYFATILGIRPSAPGFSKVRIEPQLWPLTRAKGKLPHPKGFIEVDFAIKDSMLTGTVSLPRGITGTLSYDGRTRTLSQGKQAV
jgi:hypothetical protein